MARYTSNILLKNEPFILKAGQVHFCENEDNDKYI